jgi:DNA-binding MarR family transcriptional regulator
MTSRQKRELFEELVTEVRRSQVATDRFDHAVADALGVNRTDMRCMDILEREGPLPAGRLAEAAGLTSGAMTTALDRIERAGFVRRVPDREDRRRVLVELTPEAGRVTTEFYSEHAAMGEALYDRYNARDLQLLLDFVRQGREFNERRAAELEAANQGS